MNEEFGLSVILKLVDHLSGPMRKIESTFNRMQTAYRKHGRAMRDTGRSMTMYMTAPLMGLGYLATRTAVSFESAFTGVRKTVEATEEEFAELDKGIRKLTTDIPQTYEEIAKVGEAAGQLGIQTENILGFTKVMSDLGVTTNLSSDEAATALARLANITQMPQENFDRLGSTVVDLGNNLATTEAEIVEMSLRLASAGKQIGFTQAQTLGLAGALSSLGLRAQAGGTAFSRVMIEMNKAIVKGGKEFKVFAKVAGMSGREFRELYKTDSLLAMQKFLSGVTAMGEKSTLVFEALHLGGIRVSDALRRVAGSGDLLKNAMARGSKAWRENTALTREAELRYGTAAAKFKIFWNELRLFAEDMGKFILPVLIKLMEKFRPLLKILSSLSPFIKKAAIVFIGLAAALGPLIWSIGILNGLFMAMSVGLSPVLVTLLAIGAAIGVIVIAVKALTTAWENLKRGDVLGATTFGLIKQVMTAKRSDAMERERAAVALLPGMSKSAADITLRVLGDKGTTIENVSEMGDANVNVVTQGYLGLLEAN